MLWLSRLRSLWRELTSRSVIETGIERERDVVIGVAQPGFHFPHRETQIWVAWRLQELLSRFGDSVGGFYLSVVARLAPGVSVEAAARDLDRLQIRGFRQLIGLDRVLLDRLKVFKNLLLLMWPERSVSAEVLLGGREPGAFLVCDGPQIRDAIF